MPYAAPRVCAEPGCTRAQRAARCPEHEKRDERPSAAMRGYGSAWRARRAHVLRRSPVCQACGSSPAQHVDHIAPRAQGGGDDLANLQALCAPCHSAKTAREDGGFGNRRRGAA